MLVLSRKAGEKLVVPHCNLEITVLEISAGKVRIGISAPPAVEVHRKEVWERMRRFDIHRDAAGNGLEPVCA